MFSRQLSEGKGVHEERWCYTQRVAKFSDWSLPKVLRTHCKVHTAGRSSSSLAGFPWDCATVLIVHKVSCAHIYPSPAKCGTILVIFLWQRTRNCKNPRFSLHWCMWCNQHIFFMWIPPVLCRGTCCSHVFWHNPNGCLCWRAHRQTDERDAQFPHQFSLYTSGRLCSGSDVAAEHVNFACMHHAAENRVRRVRCAACTSRCFDHCLYCAPISFWHKP
jgi:hypothetical protein